MERTYRYKDVYLRPQVADPWVTSRTDIQIEGYRLMVAPMTSVVGLKFIEAVGNLEYNLRPTICLPRQLPDEKRLALIAECDKHQLVPFVGVSIKEAFYSHPVLELAHKLNYKILLDTANGYLNNVAAAVNVLNREQPTQHIMAGNINTLEGAIHLAHFGAQYVRIGIGTGSVCSTRFAAGFYRGQVTAIQDCVPAKRLGVQLVADGGIEYAGDIVKAFGAGAQYVMIGKLFAHAEESVSDGSYWGLASDKEKPGGDFIEGVEMTIPKHQCEPLSFIVQKLWDGIRSGVSMSGYSNIGSFIGNGIFEIKGR